MFLVMSTVPQITFFASWPIKRRIYFWQATFKTVSSFFKQANSSTERHDGFVLWLLEFGCDFWFQSFLARLVGMQHLDTLTKWRVDLQDGFSLLLPCVSRISIITTFSRICNLLDHSRAIRRSRWCAKVDSFFDPCQRREVPHVCSMHTYRERRRKVNSPLSLVHVEESFFWIYLSYLAFRHVDLKKHFGQS